MNSFPCRIDLQDIELFFNKKKQKQWLKELWPLKSALPHMLVKMKVKIPIFWHRRSLDKNSKLRVMTTLECTISHPALHESKKLYILTKKQHR